MNMTPYSQNPPDNPVGGVEGGKIYSYLPGSSAKLQAK